MQFSYQVQGNIKRLCPVDVVGLGRLAAVSMEVKDLYAQL
jgi:hypothetical protein